MMTRDEFEAMSAAERQALAERVGGYTVEMTPTQCLTIWPGVIRTRPKGDHGQ